MAKRCLAAALALTLGLAGCRPVDGDPIRPGTSRPGAAAADSTPQRDPATVAQLRQLAGQNGSLAVVVYLGRVPERTTDLEAVLERLQPPWEFVLDLPAEQWVVAPEGGCELYCLFAADRRDTLFVYEKQDPQHPHQTGKELYCGRDGQPVLLLCNGSDGTPDALATVYCSTGRTLDWTPQLSGSTGQPVLPEGVVDFSAGPEPAADQ